MRIAIASLTSLCLLTACERAPSPAEPGVQPPPHADATPPPDATPDAKPADPPPRTPEQRALSLLDSAQALGDLHRAHAEDCGALAKALEGFHAEHGAALRDAPAEAHAWVDAHEPLRERLHAAMESVMTVSMACRDDAEFAALQRTLFGAPEAPAQPG